MEYLVPVLAVVVIGGLTLLAARWFTGRPSRGRTSAGGSTPAPSGAAGPERARAAARLLDEPAHRAVYGHIAQGRPAEAVREYRRHTGRSAWDAVQDVQSLTLHPQVYSLPSPEEADEDLRPGGAGTDEREATCLSTAGGVEDADIPAPQGSKPDATNVDAGEDDPADAVTSARDSSDAEREQGPHRPRRTGPPAAEELTTLTVPEDWTAEPAPEEPPFEVEVMRGDESVRLASRDLPPWLRDQLSAMLRDGNLESAAVQLSSHSTLSVPEAFELLRRMRERRQGRD